MTETISLPNLPVDLLAVIPEDEFPSEPEPDIATLVARSKVLRLDADGRVERLCSACGAWKPATQDHFPYATYDFTGTQSPCLACARHRTKAWKEANTDRYYETILKCADRKYPKGSGMVNTYRTDGETTIITCRCPTEDTVVEVLVDTADLERIRSVDTEWLAARPAKGAGLYAYSANPNHIGQSERWLHRFLMDAPSSLVVDHLAGTLDNRRSSLRIVPAAVNALHRTKPNKNNRSGYRGVCWSRKDRRWIARIKVNKVLHELGRYTEFTAACQKVHDFLVGLGVPNVPPVPTADLAVAA